MLTISDHGWDEFFDEYENAIERRRASAFVGAGLSMGPFPDWNGLVWKLAKDELQIEKDPELPLPAIAQYVVNRIGRSKLEAVLQATFAPEQPPALKPAHAELAKLGLDVVWTSNYDDLIDRAFQTECGSDSVEVLVSSSDLSRDPGKTTIVKLHGTSNDPARIVLTRQDYARYRSRNEAIYVALLNDILRRTFLFVGFSFTDPNVLGVLDDASRLADDRPRRHFAIFGRKELEKVGNQLRIEDLRILGVTTLLVNDWDEIPHRLHQLRRRLARRRVLVSGSARTLEQTRGTVEAKRLRNFSERLGRMLVDEGYTVVCGLNPAVGRPTVNGALERLHETGRRHEGNRRVLIWPLPSKHHDDKAERDRIRRGYRQEMTSLSGVGIFLGGSTGTRDEAARIRRNDGKALPVGASGGFAHALWEQMLPSFPGNLRQEFGELGPSSQLEDARLLDALKTLLRTLTA
jgi:hypothetical protein